ncbi:MAG: hypothetical protein WCP09_00760 [Candidatus Taylorbacteria bacterium]
MNTEPVVRPTNDPLVLEEMLFDNLISAYPRIPVFGHVSVVHRNKWNVCYIKCPQGVAPEDFALIVRQSERELSAIWDKPVCFPDGNSRGRDSLGNHCLAVWLPGPDRTHHDFVHFYPDS